jgi:hypothetical protein
VYLKRLVPKMMTLSLNVNDVPKYSLVLNKTLELEV